MTKIKSEKQIVVMAEAGRIAGKILQKLTAAARAGTTTKELNSLTNELCAQYKVKSAFLGYRGYPASLCVAINETVVHGIPDNMPLREGDIMGIDFGVVYRGFCADCATTIAIGKVDENAMRLMKATRVALVAAEKILRDGVRIGDIGSAISKVAIDNNFGVVRELTGHGIGRKLQEDPSIPNYGRPGTGMILREGMTICIEPMFTLGSAKIASSSDGWTIKTADSSLAAHYEHTLLITKTGCRILTPID